MFSKETLNLFADLLGQVRLNPLDPELVEKATMVATARTELERSLAEATAPADE